MKSIHPEQGLPATGEYPGAVSYGDVVDALDRNLAFFHSPESIAQTIEYAKRVGALVMGGIDSVRMVSGDGFPYYVARLPEPLAPVPEIGRFNTEQREHHSQHVFTVEEYGGGATLVSLDSLRKERPAVGQSNKYGLEKLGITASADEGSSRTTPVSLAAHRREGRIVLESDLLPCPDCIATNDFSNLRDACGPCELTPFKPRDVLRVLNDVDMQVVTDEDPEEISAYIRELIHEAGAPCNDESLEFVLRQAGIDFPVDMTVIRTDELLDGLSRLREPSDWAAVTVEGLKLWLRDEPKRWTLGRDFVFSMEPLLTRAADTEVVDAFLETKRAFLKAHDPGVVLKEVANMPRAHGRLMQSPKVREGVWLHLTGQDAPFLSAI